MAIEALLAINFVHKPQHDLESILYIILYICTFVHGPGFPDVTVPHHMSRSPPISTWFCNADVREIGYLKLAHLQRYDVAILPYFTTYWRDFSPFVKDLIIACFPVNTCLPNDFQYDQALQILKTAYDFVGEPQTSHTSRAQVFDAQCLTWTLKRGSNSLDRDSKKGKHV